VVMAFRIFSVVQIQFRVNEFQSSGSVVFINFEFASKVPFSIVLKCLLLIRYYQRSPDCRT
jgi:hypothetical protein